MEQGDRAAEAGLRFDAESIVQCANLSRTGADQGWAAQIEAGQTIAAALARDPPAP